MKYVELDDELPCGCGSGEIYSKCCKSSLAKYVRQKDGSFAKFIVPTNEAKGAIDDAKDQFRLVFGRYPKSKDRLLLLRLRSSPEDIRREFREVAELSNFPGHLIYAHERTGLLVSSETYSRLSPRDRSEWDEAIQEYLDAQANGIDLLNPPLSDVQASVSSAKKVIDNAATHFGSYLSRSPKSVSKDWVLFVQYLLLVKSFLVY